LGSQLTNTNNSLNIRKKSKSFLGMSNRTRRSCLVQQKKQSQKISLILSLSQRRFLLVPRSLPHRTILTTILCKVFNSALSRYGQLIKILTFLPVEPPPPLLAGDWRRRGGGEGDYRLKYFKHSQEDKDKNIRPPHTLKSRGRVNTASPTKIWIPSSLHDAQFTLPQSGSSLHNTQMNLQ
jgi:hypothetical protein